MRTMRLCPGSGWAALRSVIDRAPNTSMFCFRTHSSPFTLCPILQQAMTLRWVLVAGAPACKYRIGFQSKQNFNITFA